MAAVDILDALKKMRAGMTADGRIEKKEASEKGDVHIVSYEEADSGETWCGTIGLSTLHTKKTGMIMVLIGEDQSHLKVTKQLSKSRSCQHFCQNQRKQLLRNHYLTETY